MSELLFQKVKAGFYVATLADSSKYMIDHVLNIHGKMSWSMFSPYSTKPIDCPTLKAAKVVANEHYKKWAGTRRSGR